MLIHIIGWVVVILIALALFRGLAFMIALDALFMQWGYVATWNQGWSDVTGLVSLATLLMVAGIAGALILDLIIDEALFKRYFSKGH